jgi:hypothetical protein
MSNENLTGKAREVKTACGRGPRVVTLMEMKSIQAICRRLILLEAENAIFRATDYATALTVLYEIRKALCPEKPEGPMLSDLAPAVAKLRETVDDAANRRRAFLAGVSEAARGLPYRNPPEGELEEWDHGWTWYRHGHEEIAEAARKGKTDGQV